MALILIALQLRNPEVVVRRMNDPDRRVYSAPLITGSLLRYVAQYTRLKVPNSTGNTILAILSILLTLLYVFLGSGALVSEGLSCTAVLFEMVEMDVSFVRLVV